MSILERNGGSQRSHYFLKVTRQGVAELARLSASKVRDTNCFCLLVRAQDGAAGRSCFLVIMLPTSSLQSKGASGPLSVMGPQSVSFPSPYFSSNSPFCPLCYHLGPRSPSPQCSFGLEYLSRRKKTGATVLAPSLTKLVVLS